MARLPTLARFGLSTIVSGALTYGVLSLVPRDGQPAGANASPEPTVAINPAMGFAVVERSGDAGTPLDPPPSDQLIQLASYDRDAPPPPFGERAPWWTPAGLPRVERITQFDGGPLQGLNAVPAAGAMLARLGYGIVTTGSQLRSLESGEGGGTSLFELQQIVDTGWNVSFGLGVLASRDLRAILGGGGGAVIIVDYGAIPAEHRARPEFSGTTALYLDAFDSDHPGQGAAYFVIDPGGISPSEWWPADVVDRAAIGFGREGIATAWTFAAGVEPPGLGAGPIGPSAGAALRSPVGDPGPAVPPEAGTFTSPHAVEGGLELAFDLGVCLSPRAPAFCPPGIPAVYPMPEAAPPTPIIPTPIGQGPLDLLYTDVPQPGIWRTFFEAPQRVDLTFSYWLADGSGPVLKAEPAATLLGGKQVWMVTVPIPDAGSFAFVVSAGPSGLIGASEVGNISFGN